MDCEAAPTVKGLEPGHKAKIILEQDHFYSELALDLVFFTKDRPSNLG